jgi:hypothetical protein
MSKDIKGRVDGVAVWAGSAFVQVVVNIPAENADDFLAGDNIILNVSEAS